MSNVNGGTITVRVEGKDIGLSELLARINQQMATSGQSARSYATTMASIDPTLQKTQSELARYATSLASVAAAQGDTAGAQRILGSALQRMTADTTQANQVLLKLQQSINAEAAAAEKDAAAIQRLAAEKAKLANTQPANNAVAQNDAQTASLGRLVTGYFVATRVVKEFGEVINQGNELEKTLTTFRVLSGSQEQYAKNLQLAKEQQAQFGGSLNDTVEGMSSFANLSARTGIEINKLTNTARALATIDPAQGFKGAGIALKEFFSGEITSLARRFEIPREALSGIEKITDQKQKFEELTRVLEQYGISQELVAAQAGTTAVQYDKLAGNVKDAVASIGQFLGNVLLPVAKQISDVAAEAANGFNALVSRSDQLAGFQERIFSDSSGFDEFNNKITETNGKIDEAAGIFSVFTGHVQALTPAQYAYAQALVASGSSAQEALSKVQSLQEVSDTLQQTLGNNANAARFSAESIALYGSAALAVAGSSAEGATFVNELTQQVLEGNISIQQATVQLQQYQAGLAASAAMAQQAAASTNEVLIATNLFTDGLGENAIEQLNNQAAAQALKITQDQLYASALAAAQGMQGTAQAAAALSSQFGITTQQAYGLITALQQLEVAKAKQTLGIAPDARTTGHGDEILATPYQLQQQAKQIELQKQLNDVKLANARAAADAAGRVQLEQDQLSKLTKGTVEYEEQLGRVAAAERALQAEKDRNAKKGGGAPKLTPNEKINTKLLDDQDKFNDKFEDAEQKHWDKVADIYAKFNEEQQKQFAKNEVSKRRSRADFYAGLQDAPAGVDTQKFAAQYEEAFAQAQQIAQSGRAKLANEFLELRQKQIEEMKALDEEAAKINQERDEGKLSKKDAEAQLAYLEGRKKLVEDAQKEEQDQLLAAGDDNVNKLNEQLAAEEQAYAESTDKIALQAERAADAKITHAQRSKIAVSEENKVLAQQAGYYERIARVNGGQVPTAQRGTAAQSTKPATPSEDTTVDVSASSPIPVTTAEALLVRQAELFIVHDADVMSAIGDMAARIEGKLGEVVTAVNDAKSAISSAVNSVESAVGRIKINVPSVVGA